MVNDMRNYVSVDKRTKKAQKEYYSSMRGSWNGVNPVTRTMPSGKGYNRTKQRAEGKRISREYGNELTTDSFLFYIYCSSYSCLSF